MEFARAEDRRILIRVDKSGVRPGIDRLVARSEASRHSGSPENEPTQSAGPGVVLIDEPTTINYDFTGRAVVSVLARWLLHRVIFRGGWTVHVDAPDRDPIKIRCAGRAEANELATRLVVALKDRGPAALDEFP